MAKLVKIPVLPNPTCFDPSDLRSQDLGAVAVAFTWATSLAAWIPGHGRHPDGRRTLRRARPARCTGTPRLRCRAGPRRSSKAVLEAWVDGRKVGLGGGVWELEGGLVVFLSP